MSQTKDETVVGGFATVDAKGRISLPKSVRKALRLEAGSQVAFVPLDGGVVIVPQDAHLNALTERAQQALADLGINVQDLLNELPRARAEVVAEMYGADFLRDVERQIAEQRKSRPRAS